MTDLFDDKDRAEVKAACVFSQLFTTFTTFLQIKLKMVG